MSFEGLDEFVVLTDVVREKYASYLERQLQENVTAWASKSRNHHRATAVAQIPNTLEQLEDKAARGCMSARIYQRHMVKLIAMVRRNTQETRLANVLFENMQIQQNEGTPLESSDYQLVNKSTQTETQNINDKTIDQDDNCCSYELLQKIDLFQSRLEESENHHGRSNSSCKSPIGEQHMSEKEEDDIVARELAMLFGQEPKDLNEIFGLETSTNITDDPQVCALLKEIDQAELPHQNKKHSPTPTPPPLQPHHHMDNLHNSRWPCELYAQRRRLNACLIRILEEDWRVEISLREKFYELFGEDSDEEFATHITSPSIDLVDEVLLASCILRIRPWIVRNLMSPLQDGLIGNRFLFKKLAKKLANCIVLANPYASQSQVKETVEDLFCIKPRGIQNAYDLNNLPTLNVDRQMKFD
ncbi:uncharacterized protein [Drosophila tropicalis]|uniref:uncharacterized protein n=1 Tax=Drosophila tropicalis TaxID=46794 RepID=UPI0035ABAE80